MNEFLISGSIIDPRLSSQIKKILFLFTKGEIILGNSLAKFLPIWISYEFLFKLIVMVFVFVIIYFFLLRILFLQLKFQYH